MPDLGQLAAVCEQAAGDKDFDLVDPIGPTCRCRHSLAPWLAVAMEGESHNRDFGLYSGGSSDCPPMHSVGKWRPAFTASAAALIRRWFLVNGKLSQRNLQIVAMDVAKQPGRSQTA